jgi:hypothetical protein
MVLRRIFESKRVKIMGGWRKLHNKELYALYLSPDIIFIRSGKMRWEEKVARMGDIRNLYIKSKNLKIRDT